MSTDTSKTDPPGSATLGFETASLEETLSVGEALGAVLSEGDVVGLSGDLGAGKTALVRGVATGAGVDPSEVSSPTFAIVYPYRGARLTLHHADLYRLSDADELYATGYFDLWDAGAVLVEWPEQVEGSLPKDHLAIQIAWLDEERRSFTVKAHGGRSGALLARWRLRLEGAAGASGRGGASG